MNVKISGKNLNLIVFFLIFFQHYEKLDAYGSLRLLFCYIVV